jgi:hypothetical protein
MNVSLRLIKALQSTTILAEALHQDLWGSGCVALWVPPWYNIMLIIKDRHRSSKAYAFQLPVFRIFLPCLSLQVSLTEEFVPDGCGSSVQPVSAVTFGVSSKLIACSFHKLYFQAGVTVGTLYNLAEANNITILGGADATVGASGGYLQVSSTPCSSALP